MSSLVIDFTPPNDRHFDPNHPKHVAALQRAYKDQTKLKEIAPNTWECMSPRYGTPYELTLFRCSCPGYHYTSYCKHIALARMLAQLQGHIAQCPECDKLLIVYPPMTADEWATLHKEK